MTHYLADTYCGVNHKVTSTFSRNGSCVNVDYPRELLYPQVDENILLRLQAEVTLFEILICTVYLILVTKHVVFNFQNSSINMYEKSIIILFSVFLI